jgi:hypothetical protein
MISPKINGLRKISVNASKQIPRPNFQFLSNKKNESNIEKVKIAPSGFVGISTIAVIIRKEMLSILHSVFFSCFKNPIDMGMIITASLGIELVF